MNKLFTVALGMLMALLVLLPTPAHAQGQIDEAQALVQLSQDGKARVSLTLTGIGDGEVEQRIERRAPFGDLREFEYKISDVKVTSGDAEVEHDVDESKDAVTVSFDGTKAGEAGATISYVVEGAVHTPSGQAANRMFSWPVVQGINRGISKVTGSVELLNSPPDFECRAGHVSSLRTCALWTIEHYEIGTPKFEDGQLNPGDVLIISASQPAAAVADTATIHTRWTLDRAFSLNLGTALASLAVLALGALGLWFWHRRTGRDVASTLEPTVIGEFHPIAEGVSEFRVLSDIRPGQVGTVADERVDPVDVTATVLDLAVRGHLHIEQLEVPGGIDWVFSRGEQPIDDLHAYERRLLDALAPDAGEPVLVSEIQNAVGPIVDDLQNDLYDDVVAQGWFDRRPDAARTDSRTIGAGLLVLGLIATGLLAWLTTWGLVGAAIVAVGVASLFVAGEMPRRSEQGSAMLAGLHGFSAILAQQRTDIFPEGRQLEQISRVLPYAVVLGGKDRWVKAMVAADNDDTPDPEALYWFRAPADWHLQQLPQSMDALIASIQGHLFGR